jgi:hypothetical protein
MLQLFLYYPFSPDIIDADKNNRKQKTARIIKSRPMDRIPFPEIAWCRVSTPYVTGKI